MEEEGVGGAAAAAAPLLAPRTHLHATSDAEAEAEAEAKAKTFTRYASRADDELRSFRSWLRWMCVDQSAPSLAALSWSVFFVLGVAVPLASHFTLADGSGSRRHSGYDAVVQLSLTSVSAVSFTCLSAFVRRYGLRRFLFLDKLRGESEAVSLGYTAQLSRSFKLLSMFVLPCSVAECGYKVWWYFSGAARIPFLGNPYLSDVVACVLELSSWLYRTAIFFLVCVLFRLICYLQILRLQEFALVFHEESDVTPILAEHFRIRRQLRIISHRFRSFIVICLILVSLSQLASLLITTRPNAEVNLFNAGELVLCSAGLVTGMLVCLRSAAKITHKGQAITSHAAKWHVCATIDSFEAEPEITPQTFSGLIHPLDNIDDSDYEEVDEDDLEDTRPVQPNVNTISFHKRQALVTYLENNRAGITVFGSMLDRSWLHMIFGVELSLVLWLLGKTVGIS